MNDDTRGIRGFPVNRVNPYKNDQYLTEDRSVSINYITGSGKKKSTKRGRRKKTSNNDLFKKKDITRNIVRYNQIETKDYLDNVCEILKEKIDLTRGGISMFRYIYDETQNELSDFFQRDNLSITIDPDICKEKIGYESVQSVFNGITELLTKNIIARTGMTGVYFVNPNFFLPCSTLIITEYFKVGEESK